MNDRILQRAHSQFGTLASSDMRLKMPLWTSPTQRLIGAGTTVAPPVPGSKSSTQTGVDAANASDLTLSAWYPVGILASAVWVVVASFSGKTVAATVALPVIMGLWIYGIVIVDSWVRKHQRTS